MKTLTFVVLFFVVLIGAGVLGLRRHFSTHLLDVPAIVTEVRQLNNLVTVRYSIQRVVGLTEPKVPFGSESILLMVQGEVQAGIDLSQIKVRDLQEESDGTLDISLPAPKLTDAYLNEKQIKVWDRSITWWTPWVPYDPDLEHKARLQGLEDVRAAALEMGILGQAQRNAEVSIRDLLGALHLRVKYRSPD
jgi:hypothetical protein